ncbi:MAG: transglutaminase family protein [Myxococcales bacterium]|nr:transglutaminase family protein [Myxococcales bacterium]
MDANTTAVRELAARAAGDSSDPVTRAVSMYYAIRDGWRYDPWNVAEEPEGYKASAIALRDHGHCLDKALLLGACARAQGIGARLHFANVRNHIGTAALEKKLGTDLLVFHGYVELHLEGRWVAATPAFNRELCERLNVDPLEFDGRHDSIFQQYDRAGGAFMQYVHDYGVFHTLPYDMMRAEWARHYPAVSERGWPQRG